MNLAILNVNSKVVTMSSLELVQFINNQREVGAAELRHDHFMVKVGLVLGWEGVPNFRDTYINEQNGQTYACYKFPKREACLMAMSYSYDLQAKVFDRMTALEAKPAFTLPDFTNPASAARAWAIQYETSQTLTIERDHAIATKAQIGDKKVATAMATASAKSREASKLKDLLGFNTRNATVIAVEGASGKKFGKQDWRPLKAWCQGNGAASITVPCVRYGKAQAWPAGAWGAVYGVDLVELFGGAV